MLRELKKPPILIALIISLCIPILSAYYLYYDMAEDDLFSSHATYENDDIDDLFKLPNCQHQLDLRRLIGSAVFSPAFHPETNVIEQMSPCCFLSSHSEQEILVLPVRKPQLFVSNCCFIFKQT
jgi:hypothetical protein